MKQLGAMIDLDANEVCFKRMNKVTQKIYDLPTGHLAIELLREHNELMLDVDDEAIQMCKNGAEVTLGDPLMRSQMLEAPTVHGTHHVAGHCEVALKD